jgi:hypothetical protein
MKVVWSKKIDMDAYGIDTDCDVYAAYIKVSDIDSRAESMIETFSDTSWIEPLSAIKKATFRATSKRTIAELVKKIRERVEDDKLTEDFGEYLVSDTALEALENVFKHARVPLAELLKEKLTGNPGFDFHSECEVSLIAFGEAKYSGISSPYNRALKQIKDFVVLEKDMAELIVLENFVSETATSRCLDGEKAYTAAFSLNDDPERMFQNAIKNDHLAKLLMHHELYLIGVEIDDPKFD